MGATMKHRRSARKRKTTRGAERYDKILRRFKKIKKFGGSFLVNSSFGEKHPAHRTSKNNPTYKTVKIIKSD